jgi:hypothetical protein
VDFSIFRHARVRRFLVMFPVISALLAFVSSLFRSRSSLCLEHLARFCRKFSSAAIYGMEARQNNLASFPINVLGLTLCRPQSHKRSQ